MQHAARLRLALLLSWPTLTLLGLVAIPALLLIRISIAPRDPSGMWSPGFTLHAYRALMEPELLGALLDSVEMAVVVAAISLGLGFPLTYLITRMRRGQQVVWLVFLLTTLSLSDVLIAFSWQVMLSKRIGLSNVFVALGLMDAPASLTPSSGAVIACLVYLVLPFTVLTLFPVLSRLKTDVIEAARTLGASPLRAFTSVVVPLTRGPAMIAFLMAAILTVGAYVPPLVLGRPQHWPMAVLIGSTALAGHDLPRASAMSIFLLGATILLAILTARVARGRRRA
ncbi:MAG: potB [Rhodospirillales bacterium]|nr:potB [Rhodospirillales bacterium]